MSDDEPNQPNLTGLDYSAVNLQTVWTRIQAVLRQHGSLCGDEIADKLNADACGYQDPTIRYGILPRMREPLREQGFISVEEVPGDDEKITKKLWVLPE